MDEKMQISKPYTNFVNISLVKNDQGQLFTDPLWAKDILLHLDYINHFSLCCPVVDNYNTKDLTDITEYNIKKIYSLRKDYGFLSVVKNIIPNFLTVIKACRESEIVHSGGAGWAFPLSFYILPLKLFFKFQWIVVIESSFWLLGKNDKLTIRNTISHLSHKYLLRASVKSANARIFTQSYYRSLFLKGITHNTMINPATWVDESNIIPFDTLEARTKSRLNKELKFLFAGRMVEDKGIRLLLEAIKILSNKNISADISIVGTGPLQNEVIGFAKQSHGSVKVKYLQPVEYGINFFNLLQEYDLVLVPNLKEEQPRIIFDAFSQGLGVIATNTTGILDIVQPKKNAYIFETGDSHDFAETLIQALQNRNESRRLGINGLVYVKGKTHTNMHKDRLKYLRKSLNL